jgi:hypothetical protein
VLGRDGPFGFSVGPAGELVEVAEQQEAIRTMSALRAGDMSVRAIAAAVESRHGIRISHAGVDKVLASPRGGVRGTLKPAGYCPARPDRTLIANLVFANKV